MTALAAAAEARGSVRFALNTRVTGFSTQGQAITAIHTQKEKPLSVPAGTQVVVAAGSWTGPLLRKLGLYTPLYPLRGYCLAATMPDTLSPAQVPNRIIADAQQAVYMTRFGNQVSRAKHKAAGLSSQYQVRVTAFGEFAGFSTEPDKRLEKQLRHSAAKYIPGTVLRYALV